MDRIMEEGNNGNLYSDQISTSKFGVHFENGFVLSEDGKHVSAPDAKNMRRILVEDLTNGASFRFGENEHAIFTLSFNEDSGTLLAGDESGHLVEYHLDLQKREGLMTKKVGRSDLYSIYSFSSVRGLLFFGQKNKVRVYDTSSKEVLPGVIETAIGCVYSLQVCVVDDSPVWLAVVGSDTEYSGVKSDLYDLGGLLRKVLLPCSLGDNLESLSSTDAEQIRIKDLRIEELRKDLSVSHAKTQGIFL